MKVSQLLKDLSELDPEDEIEAMVDDTYNPVGDIVLYISSEHQADDPTIVSRF